MLDYKETTYVNEAARNVFTFKTIMINVPYILYTLLSGLSALSGCQCSVLVLFEHECVVKLEDQYDLQIKASLIFPFPSMLNVNNT